MKPLQRKHTFIQSEIDDNWIEALMRIRETYVKRSPEQLLKHLQIPIDVDKRPELYKSLGEVRTVKPDKEYTFTEISDNLTNQINKYHGTGNNNISNLRGVSNGSVDNLQG